MGAIWTSKTRTRQPQGVVGINRGNPLTKRITTLVPFGPAGMFDLVGGAKVALSSGTVDADQRGISLRGSGSAACASIPLNLSAYTKIVLSFWMYWNAFANDDDLAMEFTANGASTTGGFGLDPNESATSRFQIFGKGGGNTGAKSFTRPSAAAWHHYMVGLDTSVSGFVSSVYVDGVSQSLITDVTGNVTVSFANSTLYLFSRNNANLFAAGRMQNLVIRGGADLLASEANAEYSKPWSLFAPQRTARIYSFPTAGGGATVAVPAGALTLTGYAPTVAATAHQTIAVPKGALVLSAFAPTVSTSAAQTIAVPAASLTLTGFAPTVAATANQSISVPAGSLTLTGYAPTVYTTAVTTIAVPAGTLTLTGYAPTVSYTTHASIGVPAGALTLTGYAPTVTGGESSIWTPASASSGTWTPTSASGGTWTPQ